MANSIKWVDDLYQVSLVPITGHAIAICATPEYSTDMCKVMSPDKSVSNLKPVFLKLCMDASMTRLIFFLEKAGMLTLPAQEFQMLMDSLSL